MSHATTNCTSFLSCLYGVRFLCQLLFDINLVHTRIGVRTFRRRIFGTFRRQPLDVCVVVICRFNTVLRVRVILSAGDVDCSFSVSFSFRWLWFLVSWSSSQLVGMDCSFSASFAFPLWFLGVPFNGQFIHRLLCCAVLHWMTVTRKQAG